MPRSFLVKKPPSHKVPPDYGQLETQKEISNLCHSCGGLVFPFLPREVAPPLQGDAPAPWERGAALARITLDSEVRGATGLGDPLPGRAPTTPLRESWNDLNLPRAPSPRTRAAQEEKGAPSQAQGDVQRGPVEALHRFECFDCHKSYHTFSGLAKHRQLHCRLQSRRSFACKYCEKEYVSLGALKMHIRTHTLPCVCKICGKAFSRPWLLQGHIRTHTGEKPFACSHCSRAFADRSNLRAHLQTHSDIKKYRCQRCAKTFSRVSLLSKHEEAGCQPPS
ncbi:zinc finger protein SNAI3 [Rhinatrema bivittatum]|uniref:zinc finger protein SNAI3 n=1 Tax=Rhinatrema bivittatum TaxID=194408 RepID=UPI00112BB09A|nr:zinc finger protein SNAI3 [Rhinatrema bivittatum]